MEIRNPNLHYLLKSSNKLKTGKLLKGLYSLPNQEPFNYIFN